MALFWLQRVGMNSWVKAWKSLNYLGLLVLSSFLLQSMFREFIEGIKTYQVLHQPLLPEDNPTAVACLLMSNETEMNMGSDINVTVHQYRTSAANLVQGSTSLDLDSSVNVTKLLLHEQGALTADGGHLTCVSIDPMLNDLTQVITRVEIVVKNLEESTSEEFLGQLFFTSKENSYGAVTGKWYDGKVNIMYLDRMRNLPLTLSKITGYTNLQSSCTEQSYYECLGSGLKMSQECAIHGGVCHVASLPSTQFPDCKTNTSYKCSSDLFWKIFTSKECRSDGIKKCTTMEYQVDFAFRQGSSNALPNPNSISFEYQIQEKASSNGERHDVPMKTMKREEVVWSALPFIANLGGILATIIEFSFIGVGHWIIQKLNTEVIFRHFIFACSFFPFQFPLLDCWYNSKSGG